METTKTTITTERHIARRGVSAPTATSLPTEQHLPFKLKYEPIFKMLINLIVIIDDVGQSSTHTLSCVIRV